jgi:tetratricopeptide (TPR) repeat protein
MKPFFHDIYTGSFLEQRRRKRTTIVLATAALVITLTGMGVRLARSGRYAVYIDSRPVLKQRILSDWEAKRWNEVLAASQSSLASAPLDPFYLTFRGLAAFYKAAELPDGEDRTALLDDSIATIRKAKAVGGRMPRAQAEYVLGKAYFHKGKYYYDEAIKFLESSIVAGYEGADSREYLALAYAGLNDKVKAIANFDAALLKSRSELLLAAGKAFLDSGNGTKAESLLKESLAIGTDALTREKCLFILADIYHSRGDSITAEAQYDLILEKNPESADAHFRLGILYQERGDPVRARAAWRRAIAIDPMHAASRQKLTEKL